MLQYSQIIHQAWNITLETPKLKWFAFVPSFMAVLIFVLEISWQLWLYLTEFGVIESRLSFAAVGDGVRFLIENNLIGWAVFLLFFVLFFMFVVPAFVSGVLILSTQQKALHPDRMLSIRQKMIEGSEHFFPLFEFHAIVAPFSLISIGLFTATLYRYFHDSLFQMVLPLILIHVVFSFLVAVLTSFAPYFIVCEGKSVSTAIRKSLGLVFLNFGTTLSIVLLMLLVNFRIIVNVLMVLLVPLGIIAAVVYFANSLLIALSVIFGIVLLAFAAYLTAIVEVFATAVWERAFVTMREHQKSLETDAA